MEDTPHRIITRERQRLAEMERTHAEVEAQQRELADLIRRRRARLAEMQRPGDD